MRALRPGGGTGRRTRFRVWRLQNRGGSNPLLGMTGWRVKPPARLFSDRARRRGPAPPRSRGRRLLTTRPVCMFMQMHAYSSGRDRRRLRVHRPRAHPPARPPPAHPPRRALLRSLVRRHRREPAAARRSRRVPAVPGPRRGGARRRRARVPRDARRGVRRARAEAARAGRAGDRPVRSVPARGRGGVPPLVRLLAPRARRSSPRRATGCPSSRGSSSPGRGSSRTRAATRPPSRSRSRRSSRRGSGSRAASR